MDALLTPSLFVLVNVANCTNRRSIAMNKKVYKSAFALYKQGISQEICLSAIISSCRGDSNLAATLSIKFVEDCWEYGHIAQIKSGTMIPISNPRDIFDPSTLKSTGGIKDND